MNLILAAAAYTACAAYELADRVREVVRREQHLADWRREVWALADLELAELVEEEGQ